MIAAAGSFLPVITLLENQLIPITRVAFVRGRMFICCLRSSLSQISTRGVARGRLSNSGRKHDVTVEEYRCNCLSTCSVMKIEIDEGPGR